MQPTQLSQSRAQTGEVIPLFSRRAPEPKAQPRPAETTHATYVAAKLEWAAFMVGEALDAAPCLGVRLSRGQQDELAAIRTRLETIAAEIEADAQPLSMEAPDAG